MDTPARVLTILTLTHAWSNNRQRMQTDKNRFEWEKKQRAKSNKKKYNEISVDENSTIDVLAKERREGKKHTTQQISVFTDSGYFLAEESQLPLSLICI